MPSLFFAVWVMAFLPQGAFAQKDMGVGFCSAHGQYSGSSCPTCSSNNGGGNYYTPPARDYEAERRAAAAAAAAAAERQRLQRARAANERGLDCWNKKDWAGAVANFQSALNTSPHDSVIRKNLAQAKSELLLQQIEEEKRSRDKAAAANMQLAINQFAQSLATTPAVDTTSGGLDFTSAQTQDIAKPAALEFGDPMVVDARSPQVVKADEKLRDAVAATSKGNSGNAQLTTVELNKIEADLRTRLSKTTNPSEKAHLTAQLAWSLQQKGDTAGAIRAINEASALDAKSPMLGLLALVVLADTKEKYADAIVAAQALLKQDPSNRAAAGILAEADTKLRKATGENVTAGVPLAPFSHENQKPSAETGGSAENDKARAEKEFVFQSFGKQSHAPHWQEPPILDKRIPLEKHPELKQKMEKRAALVAESRTVAPEKAEEIKKQVKQIDEETTKQEKEILKKDFPDAPGDI